MIWRVCYLVSFLAGLALAVNSMLLGAERWRRKSSARQSPVFNPPAASALAVGLGTTGYLLTARTGLGWFPIMLISVFAGAAALSGMIVLMSKWALRGPAVAQDIDEDDLQGQIATVTRTISGVGPGEITWSAWGTIRTVPAMSVDNSEIPEDSEVVIETIEGDVARVELWSAVEQRL